MGGQLFFLFDFQAAENERHRLSVSGLQFEIIFFVKFNMPIHVSNIRSGDSSVSASGSALALGWKSCTGNFFKLIFSNFAGKSKQYNDRYFFSRFFFRIPFGCKKKSGGNQD